MNIMKRLFSIGIFEIILRIRKEYEYNTGYVFTYFVIG